MAKDYLMTHAAPFIFHKPGSFPRLLPGEIHLWCARLIPQPGVVPYFHNLLDKDERARALSFYHDRDRVRYILAHGYLRSLLGKYINERPSEVIFRYEAQGKPYLESHPVEFNMSHSSDRAVFVFSQDRVLGVDIEGRREIPEAEDIINRLFTSREKWNFKLTSKNNRQDLFLKWWTQGEAVVKAVGHGFGERLGAVSRRKVIKEGKTWGMESFIPAPGYIGAIAALMPLSNISCFTLDDGLIKPLE